LSQKIGVLVRIAISDGGLRGEKFAVVCGSIEDVLVEAGSAVF